MAQGHKPNWRTDTRRSRIRDGECTFSHCARSSGVTYYGVPVCDKCFNYYSDLKDNDALKRVLKIRITEPKTELDDFEEDMFT
jgi:hypothetical protein